ncbi:MAG TPA: hypothetical protein VOB72_23320 [Candidatus Dormibacteraeota bacterium]|nr:hypothetical protein [Candidatus Dormibacteraeota bacterium]
MPITDRIAEAAAELRARHPKPRLPDALAVLTGAAIGAQRALTGHDGWRRLE